MANPGEPGSLVALGVIVGLVSTCVQSFGLTLQRKSHIEDEKRDYGARRPPYRRRRWQIGMLLFLIANIVGSTIQITTLPLPLLSTLQASGLVFNSLLACLLLKEPWAWRTAYGTVLVAAGAVLVSYFSAVPEPSHTLRELLALLSTRGFLIWFILSLVLVASVLLMTWALRYWIAHHRRGTPRVLLINGMSFGMVSGILSAHALLLAKSAVELIVRSVSDHQNQFVTFQPWLLVLAFVFFALSQLYYLHLGLKLISTSVLYPFVFCIYNIVAILDGLIYFRQMDQLPPLHAGLIALGTVLLLSGVLTLSWRLEDRDDEDQMPLSKPEIPQTVLAPGMGFVGDPPSESSSDVASLLSVRLDDSDSGDGAAESSGEHSPLLRQSHRALHRSRTTSQKIPQQPTRAPSSTHTGRRRRRAATLKEVKDIWDALEDSIEQYGTFGNPRRASTASNPSRPSTAGGGTLPRQRDKPADLSSAAAAAAEDGTDALAAAHPRPTLSRASTMPTSRRHSDSTSRRRRKSVRFSQGSALFADLLSRDWWRMKRKEDEDEDAEEDLNGQPDDDEHHHDRGREPNP